MDLKIFDLLNGLAGQFLVFDWLAIFFANFLQYFLIALSLLLLFLTKKYSLREKVRVFWVTTVSVVISRFVIAELIRFFYHRPRPFLAYSVHQLISENGYSFPSGHATFFFALATTVYFYNKRWGLWLFAASALMGVARIIVGVHYPSDILGGALIGIITGWTVFHAAEALIKKPQ